MPSPFPGMNPYLERAADWGDFHNRFITFLGGLIERDLPEPFRTRIDENLYIHEFSAEERRLIGRPDIIVTTPNGLYPDAATATLAAPVIGGVPEGIDIVEISFLEIRDKRNDRVVTTIEVLSPCNKDGSGDMEMYRTKVFKLLRTAANFVEIDLLRHGQRTKWLNLPKCDYSIAVSLASARPQVSFWPIGLRERLPSIPIPLLDGTPPVIVDLQQVLDQVYDSARYGRYIYRQPVDPPLSPNDEAWAMEILATAAKS